MKERKRRANASESLSQVAEGKLDFLSPVSKVGAFGFSTLSSFEGTPEKVQPQLFFENYTEETKCINQDHRVITDSVVIKWFERTF